VSAAGGKKRGGEDAQAHVRGGRDALCTSRGGAFGYAVAAGKGGGGKKKGRTPVAGRCAEIREGGNKKKPHPPSREDGTALAARGKREGNQFGS